MLEPRELLNIKEASVWATEHIGKDVTPSNIAYLINYGRIPKIGDNGGTLVAKKDLIDYYKNNQRETNWKKQLGADLNCALSFDQYTESQTRKHVHRLRPYSATSRDAQEIGAITKNRRVEYRFASRPRPETRQSTGSKS